MIDRFGTIEQAAQPLPPRMFITLVREICSCQKYLDDTHLGFIADRKYFIDDKEYRVLATVNLISTTGLFSVEVDGMDDRHSIYNLKAYFAVDNLDWVFDHTATILYPTWVWDTSDFEYERDSKINFEEHVILIMMGALRL